MAHDFKVLSSQLLFDAPIIAVRKDELAMPNEQVAYRDVVEHMGAVAVAAVNDAGEIAMVHQYRHAVKRRLWELPAGLLDVKDESELAGAQRELVEEAGLKATQWSVLADIVTSPGFCEETARVYLAQDLTEVERPEAFGDEEADMDFAWIKLDEAVAKVLAGEINNSIAVTGIFAAWQVLNGHGQARDVTAPFDLRPTSIATRRSGPDLKKQ
ncbi:NUDIX domain-containing protein [Corynebacterium stationis]|uniref:NUDIX domain-containing protein n=1 Tax=Corynebacterium stationis TaxID=1705 RepID=UPI00076F6AFD|nr:NUDIX hydrolase [Corynebacterium stationis]AMJ44681.1 ADP-ribose pyrophosphatase [Corynebacterium stationis]AQX71140.1 ADP-ribose pyrophosphatase [Corynebacterium stationis]ASJ18826.1 ADP-ribose pyrophosphatase [Corynebacterium stationis]HJG64686.1 NUDIX hydrolase [Corynebacterium stationis]